MPYASIAAFKVSQITAFTRTDGPIDRRTLNGKIDSASDPDQEYKYSMGFFLYIYGIRPADWAWSKSNTELKNKKGS